jgi:hypothetical protein
MLRAAHKIVTSRPALINVQARFNIARVIPPAFIIRPPQQKI